MINQQRTGSVTGASTGGAVTKYSFVKISLIARGVVAHADFAIQSALILSRKFAGSYLAPPMSAMAAQMSANAH